MYNVIKFHLNNNKYYNLFYNVNLMFGNREINNIFKYMNTLSI